MLAFVGNPEDRFSQNSVHKQHGFPVFAGNSRGDIRCLANRSSIILPDQRMNINKCGITGKVKEKQQYLQDRHNKRYW